jgi:molybdopterin-guanine dinucleotide biosynthesis protein A
LSGPAIAFSGIVLAGGESRRMGRPKALLPFAGEILIVRVLKRLSAVTDEQVVVVAPGQDLPDLPARLVRDPEPHRGPVAGLAVGLAAARAPRAFVTSCDSPFLSLDLVRWMLGESAGWDVVVPEWEGRLNPLHAVYATALAGTYRRLLDAGRSRPVDAYPEARVRVVREEEIRRLDPLGRSLTNMNSPEEYERALAEAARESA